MKEFSEYWQKILEREGEKHELRRRRRRRRYVVL
jgi:hypothetical protein